jgi:hypothetical protein
LTKNAAGLLARALTLVYDDFVEMAYRIVLRTFTCGFLAAIASAAPTKAQGLLAPRDLPEANRLLDSDSKAPRSQLKCDVQIRKPFVDFDFRFVSLFEVSASLAQFAPGRRIELLLRVTPTEGKPVLLANGFRIPRVPPNLASGFKPDRFGVNVGGGFATGAGRYQAELLVLDDRGRSHYKKWNVEAKNDSKDSISPVLARSAVAPLIADRWNGKLDPKGLHLTVLLDATAPGVYSSNFGERFLLQQMLASLLREVPCASVRVVAFNMDQEREVFRDENFGPAGFARLSVTLKNLQVAVVSYRALQRGNSTRFLAGLVQEQISAPADAVIFLGSNMHVMEKPSKEMKESLDPGPAHVFYFEYVGYRRFHFPDSIEYLTQDLHGTVFQITSARDFGGALQKMDKQLGTARRRYQVPR